MRKVCGCVFVLILTVSALFAKDEVFQTVTWPDSGPAVICFTFSKFRTLGSQEGRERNYATETKAENVSNKRIGNAGFVLYVFDKSKARVGEGYISLSNVAPGETVRFEVKLTASGTPVSLTVVPTTSDAARSLSITVNSVPQGAELSVDGKAMGITPKIIEVGIGKHLLEFSKEGFTNGKFPLEMTSRDASGGSVSYELGSAARDTIELRDGSVVSGDVISISGMKIEVRIGGNVQSFDRNQVKRILFTERDPPTN